MNPLIEFIGGIAILIFVHELGHFLAARLFGVEVEEFGIGFPPRIVKLFEAGGTEFTLNWIPLGGFVRPKGENDPDVPGGLAAANPWVRLAVLFAGPLMNIGVGIILAVLLFYNLGDPVLDRIQILQVAENSPAAEAGLMADDVILDINGEKMNSSDDIYEAIQASLGEPTTIVYERNGNSGQVTLVPRADPPEGEGAIGIAMGPTTRPISLVTAVPRGVMASFDYTRAVLSLPVKIFQGEVSAEESRPLGYKGMYDVYTQLQNPLWFFTAISMSLGIFNLFPIPALDGGRILLTLPEILLRRRIPPKYENTIHLVGFTLLLILLIYINVQDFVNPVQLP